MCLSQCRDTVRYKLSERRGEDVARLNLSEAARQWGISRATVNRRKKDGTLSVHKDGRTVTVDRSEMQRVFGNAQQVEASDDTADTVSGSVRMAVTQTQQDTSVETALLQQKVEFLEQQNEQLQGMLEQISENEKRLLSIVETQALRLSDERQKSSSSFWARIFG